MNLAKKAIVSSERFSTMGKYQPKPIQWVDPFNVGRVSWFSQKKTVVQHFSLSFATYKPIFHYSTIKKKEQNNNNSNHATKEDKTQREMSLWFGKETQKMLHASAKRRHHYCCC